MNYNRFIKTLLPCAAMAGAVVLASCTDNDYDFDQIDATVGFGGDGLTLTVNSTDTIKLADVLELDGNDCVVEEPNGDYVFRQTGDPVAPVNPEIGRITVSGSSDEGVIELPLRPDPDDRPRQCVDFRHGKPAVTRYAVVARRFSDEQPVYIGICAYQHHGNYCRQNIFRQLKFHSAPYK